MLKKYSAYSFYLALKLRLFRLIKGKQKEQYTLQS